MNNERVKCADGFSMSVQAGRNSYCTPRTEGAKSYEEVEVGFPSDYEPLIAKYAENNEDYTGTVYGYVPSQVVTLVCIKHGGVVSGELPAGVPYISAS